MSVYFTMCVWSWRIQRSWLLKGQSACVSPADSTLLSPDCVSVCGDCFLFFFLSLSPPPLPFRVWVHACILVCSVSAHVRKLAWCAIQAETSWKGLWAPVSVDLLQTPPALPQLLPVARSTPGYAGSYLQVDFTTLDPTDISPLYNMLPRTQKSIWLSYIKKWRL